MAWRGLHLTQPSRLSLADGQIVVAQEDGEARVAIEDTAWVVIDSPRTTMTASLISACMAGGVAVVFTDEAHTPSGLALPFHRHHRQADVGQFQAQASRPLKKRLWQAIVRRKIENQAAALDAVGAKGANGLREMARGVASGDPNNTEAQAARAYWRKFCPEFSREDAGVKRNGLLNYGYAVVRAGVARALTATGLLPCFRAEARQRVQRLQPGRRLGGAVPPFRRRAGVAPGAGRALPRAADPGGAPRHGRGDVGRGAAGA
jgi:CRISP-associated protein Cas1